MSRTLLLAAPLPGPALANDSVAAAETGGLILRFEMRRTHWRPTRDLHVLILVPQRENQ